MLSTILDVFSWICRLCYLVLALLASQIGMSTLLRKLSKKTDFILATREPVKTDGAQRPEIGVAEKRLSDAHKFFKAVTSLSGVSDVIRQV
jgi:hypothetical protein